MTCLVRMLVVTSCPYANGAGLHYKRTGAGEHYPWWDKNGNVIRHAGYLCTDAKSCQYAGCNFASSTCKWNGKTTFHHKISVCTSPSKALCDF